MEEPPKNPPDVPADPNVHSEPTLAEAGPAHADGTPDGGTCRIGPYRLITVLGEGGFGIVYLAEQPSPQRRVALKILRAGVAGPQTLSRFGHEAQTLGLLQHPGIAQVFEAGFYDPKTGRTLTDDGSRAVLLNGGLPFFAMEFVEGSPLTGYARDAKLSRRARLELLIQVAEAVQHAHTKGVIHRDLKPANILVDQSGRAKVLDFGVARVTSDQVQRTLQTDVGQLVGTLGYMSPEQIAADPAAVDTRADVYALGAILYELLSGHPPHRVEGKVLHEATRVICDEPPSRLASIDRTLRGDLDTIVAKALEKDKARRYQTASDLAADLRRYLGDQPIVARPPSTGYQLRKFARRNKPLVGGVIASFVLLAAGVVATSYWAVRATAAEKEQKERREEAETATKEATKQRDIARREADKARAVVQFLETTLAAADPDRKGRDVRLADMLDTAVAEVDTSLDDKPEIAAAMRKAVAGAYRGLGLIDQADAQATKAVETLTKLNGPDHPDTLDAREVLARIRMSQSRHAEAEADLPKIYDARIRAAGREDQAALDALSTLANVYVNQGKLDEAIATERRVVEGFTKLQGADGLDTLAESLLLAQILAEATQTDEAEKILTRVLDARLRTLEPTDQRLQSTRDALGGLYRMQGKYAQAAEVYTATLESYKIRYGPEHPKTISKATDLGKALQQAGKLDDAEAVLRTTLETSRRINGPDHFDTLTAAGFLADTLQVKGDLDEAATLRRAVAEGRAKSLGPDHPQTLIAWTNVAYILTDLKRYNEAEQVLLNVLDARRRILGPEHGDVALTLSLLGLNAVKAQQLEQAEDYLRRCLAIREKILPEGAAPRGITMSILGETLMLRGQLAEAEPLIFTGGEWVLADARVPARVKNEVVDRAVRLCEKLGKADIADAWRARSSQASRSAK